MYENSPWPIRKDLSSAHVRALKRIATPGSWWTGAQRIAIAAAAREARSCSACRARRQSIASDGNFGTHGDSTVIETGIIDVVHRIAEDANRLTRSTVDAIIRDTMTDGRYVELVGVVATIIALDRFCISLGLPLHEFPAVRDGEPDAYRPACAVSEDAWVPTIAPEDAAGPEADIYRGQSAAYIHRALSLVPAEKTGFFDLDDVMYLPDSQLRDFDNEFRAISHAQIELVAARVSALNQCVY